MFKVTDVRLLHVPSGAKSFACILLALVWEPPVSQCSSFRHKVASLRCHVQKSCFLLMCIPVSLSLFFLPMSGTISSSDLHHQIENGSLHAEMLQSCLDPSDFADQPLNQLIKFSACCHWKLQSDIIKTEQQMTAVAFVRIIQWFKYQFWQKCQTDNTPIFPMHARKSRENFYYKCLTDNLYESQKTKRNA